MIGRTTRAADRIPASGDEPDEPDEVVPERKPRGSGVKGDPLAGVDTSGAVEAQRA